MFSIHRVKKNSMDNILFRQEAKLPPENKIMERTKRPCAYKYLRCTRFISIMYTLIIMSLMVTKSVVADVQLGEQHCGDASCSGKILKILLTKRISGLS